MNHKSKIRVQAETVLRNQEKLEETIRDYSRSQLEYWQMVPYLAVNASNKQSYPTPWLQCAINRMQSTKTKWPLERLKDDTDRRTLPWMYIECTTGEIMYEHIRQQDANSQQKPTGILLLAKKIELLDAKTLVGTLELLGKFPERGTYQVTRSDCRYNTWTEDANDDWIKERALKTPEIQASKAHYEQHLTKCGKSI